MHISSIPYLLFQYYLQTTSPIVINRLNEISFVSIEIASNSTCMRTIYFPKSTIRIQTGHTTWSSPLPALVSKCTTVSCVLLNPVEYRAYLTPMNAVPNQPIAIDAIQPIFMILDNSKHTTSDFHLFKLYKEGLDLAEQEHDR